MALEVQTNGIRRFGVFEVDLRSGELRKQGVRIKLQDQPFQVLKGLLQLAGELVTREGLRSEIWAADTFVGFDNGLNTSINKLREALGDLADSPRFIETLQRRGYRFIAPVIGLESKRLAATEPHSGDLLEPKTSLGRRRKIAVLSLLALAMVAGAVVWYQSMAHSSNPSRSSSKPSPQTIAVLPFHDISAVPSDTWAIGMTDAVISRLTSLQNLAVRPTISVMKYAQELTDGICRVLLR